ncbi:periplasmic heavy metal sensor [Iocasia frigidifontis]|uniref:Periplasmic heavy metal sensor n=1 Tax=Iocasia fonsfrigidae TaxID=2682810 RepID=A0A8A7KC59_9FIRM|nr:periplasmic heavy metal sensor [Iocasia fonsfrigidae]QTL97168.1 periplasmic heavy metal sensor [Iocasia fonsfrigidae]
MRKKILITALMALILALGVSSYSLAYGGGPAFRPGGGFMHYGMHHGPGYQDRNPLDLTEEQQTQLRELQDEHFSQMEDNHQELFDLNNQLREAVFAGGEELISGLKDKIGSLENELTDLRVDYWRGLQDILTEEQLLEMEEWFNKGRGFRGRGMGMGLYDNAYGICPYIY